MSGGAWNAGESPQRFTSRVRLGDIVRTSGLGVEYCGHLFLVTDIDVNGDCTLEYRRGRRSMCGELRGHPEMAYGVVLQDDCEVVYPATYPPIPRKYFSAGPRG